MDLRTLAPTPSDCSIARKTCRIARGTVMLAGFDDAKKAGGVKRRPKKNGLVFWDWSWPCDVRFSEAVICLMNGKIGDEL